MGVRNYLCTEILEEVYRLAIDVLPTPKERPVSRIGNVYRAEEAV